MLVTNMLESMYKVELSICTLEDHTSGAQQEIEN